MDAVLTAVAQSAPQLGISGALVLVIVLLLRREASTETRHGTELERVMRAHDAELAELRTDITNLRKQVADGHAALDLERDKRRQIEDKVAAASQRQKRV